MYHGSGHILVESESPYTSRGSRGWKSPSGVQGQSPGRGLGGWDPPEAEAILLMQHKILIVLVHIQVAKNSGIISTRWLWDKTQKLLGQVWELLEHLSQQLKVKYSHTRYWALGLELIPVYRQSARRWREVNHAINLAVGCHYFLPGLWLPL